MTTNNRDLSRWQVAGQPFALECTDEVIEQLRRWTLTADLFPPDRGVLWGTREGQTVRVLAVSQHADEQSPPQQVRVGWFQVRLETEIRLTAEDLLYHDESFPEAGATVLILRPATAGGIRVGVFFREANGGMRTESSYQEVMLPGESDALLPSLPARPAIKTAIKAAPSARRTPAPVVRTRWSRTWIAFLTGTLAGALGFAIVRGQSVPSSSTGDAATRALAQQTRQLQSELDAEKLHNRRLEETLSILRERARSKASPVAQSLEKEAQAFLINPLF